MAARKGAPKPDISTVEAFKRALLDAKSIAYVEAGAGAPYFKGLFERLGIADQVKPKFKSLPTSNPAAHAVANGEAELGITAISEILPYAGAELVGPLPAEIQFYSVSAAVVAANAKEPEAATIGDPVPDRAGRRRGAQGQGADAWLKAWRIVRNAAPEAFGDRCD